MDAFVAPGIPERVGPPLPSGQPVRADTVAGLSPAAIAAAAAQAATPPVYTPEQINQLRDVKSDNVSPVKPTPMPQISGDSGSDTAGGASMPVRNCPHCGWDLQQPDVPEPSDDVKRRFLFCLFPAVPVPFEHEYTLFNGHMVVRFRTLRNDEVAAVSRHAERLLRETGTPDRDSSLVSVLQATLRIRLALQLVAIKTPDRDEVFPKGFSVDPGDPDHKSLWHVPENREDVLFAALIRRVYDEILGSEAVSQVVAQRLADFNRMVSKMAAHAGDANFWPATLR
jgi:hypothetical protein